MAQSSNPDLIGPELVESARKAVKSNSIKRLINLILQILQNRYLERRPPITFLGIMQLLQISDMKETLIGEMQRNLIINPKIKYDPKESLYSFKPSLDIKSPKDIRKLLQFYESQGKGGILLSEVREAVPNFEPALEKIKDDLFELNPTRDKAEKALFFNNKDFCIELDENFTALWRSISVEGIGSISIESELRKYGIDVIKGAMENSQERGVKRKSGVKEGRRNKRRNTQSSHTHHQKGFS